MGWAIARLLEWSESQELNEASAVLPTIVWVLVLNAAGDAPLPAGRVYVSGRRAPEARKAFLEELRAMPGDVWVVNHSWDGILAGKGSHAEMDALDAVLIRGDKATIDEVLKRVCEPPVYGGGAGSGARSSTSRTGCLGGRSLRGSIR